jgi:hypothetical protein
MVEVFKTNVIDTEDAQRIIDVIHNSYAHYSANFALDDCDKILRIKALNGCVIPVEIITIVADNGFTATVLPDEIHPVVNTNLYAGFRKLLQCI